MKNLSPIEMLIEMASQKEANNYLSSIILDGEEKNHLEVMADCSINGNSEMERVMAHLNITIKDYIKTTMLITDGKVDAIVCGYSIDNRFGGNKYELVFNFNNMMLEQESIREICPYCESEIVIKNNFSVQNCHLCGSKIKSCSICDRDKEECKSCFLNCNQKVSMIEGFKKINKLLRSVRHHEVSDKVNKILDECSIEVVKLIDMFSK